MKRLTGKVIRILAAVLLVVLATFLVLAATVVWRPEMLLTPGALTWTKSLLERRGIRADWQSLQLQTRGFLSPHYRIVATNLCIDARPGFLFCADRLDTGVQVALPTFTIVRIDSPIAEGVLLDVVRTPRPETVPSQPPSLKRYVDFASRLTRPLSLRRVKVSFKSPTSDVKASIERLNAELTARSVALSGAGLCIQAHAGSRLDACISTVTASARYRFAGGRFELTEIERFELEGERLHLVQKPSLPGTKAPPRETTPRTSTRQLEAMASSATAQTARLLGTYKVNQLDLRIADVQVENENWQASGSVRLTGRGDAPLQLTAHPATVRTPTDRIDIRTLQVNVRPTGISELSLQGEIAARARSGLRLQANVDADFAANPFSSTFRINGQGSRAGKFLRVTLRGTGTTVYQRFLLSARARGFPIDRIESCSVALAEPPEVRLNVDFEDCSFRLQAPVRSGLPTRLSVDGLLAGQIRIADSITSDIRLSWREGPTRPPLRFRGNARLQLAGTQGTPLRTWTIRPQVNATLQVPRFEALVATLRESRYAVPAPFAALTGPLTLTATSSGEGRNFTLPVVLTTDLRSPQQRFRTSVRNRIRVDLTRSPPRVALDTTADLTEVALVLPNLRLTAPPRVRPDTRIRLTETEALPIEPEPEEPAPMTAPPTSSQVTWRVRVSTPPTSPLLLHSNLAKKPIPLTLRLQAAHDSPVVAQVESQSFPVEFFRRTALVNAFSFQMLPDGTRTIDGRVTVDYGTMVIRILVSGEAENPVVEFESTPARPRRDILMALMFGKEIEELSTQEQTSVDNMEAAVADGALSLASLYFLASTPIQSVGYNPATKDLSLQLRLPEGTIVEVGRNQEAERVGAIKRLSRNIFVRTFLERASTSEDLTVSTLLEWSKTYW